MGTRADFYVGRGLQARWIGSIAWDGYRSGIDEAVLCAHAEAEYLAAVREFFQGRGDVTRPEQGWPWPWSTSETSDCSYWFFDGRVWDARGRRYGYVYAPCDEPEPDWSDSAKEEELYAAWLGHRERVEFPVMNTQRSARVGDTRSGTLVFTVARPPEGAR